MRHLRWDTSQFRRKRNLPKYVNIHTVGIKTIATATQQMGPQFDYSYQGTTNDDQK